MVAYHDRAYHLGTRAYEYMIANNRPRQHSEAHIRLSGSQSYSLHDGAVVTDMARTNDCTNGMRKEQASTYAHLRGYFNAKNKDIEHREKLCQNSHASLIEKLSEP